MKEKLFLSCVRALEQFKTGPFVMVIFGGRGDLSRKKLIPTLYNLYRKNFIKDFKVLAVGRTEVSTKRYREEIGNWIKNSSSKFEEVLFEKFKKNFIYKDIDLEREESYRLLCSYVNRNKKYKNTIYYLALPFKIVPFVVGFLSRERLCKKTKIVIEKPFGKDKKTARDLNKNLLSAFNEDQIYRIDHYLGKETVQNIFFFRFGNTLFEPLWNREYISHVEVTAIEDIGVEGRGSFYEEVGILRDMVQNHILQLISLVAMEPPKSFSAIRDERIKIIESIGCKRDIVLGQYIRGELANKKAVGYLDEEGVRKNSRTPTYFAGKFLIDNRRWRGVPFYVRCGKRLKKRLTEIVVQFKYPPLKLLGHKCGNIEHNALLFSIYPKQKISLLLNVKFPGMENVPYLSKMEFDYKRAFNVEPPLAYERLLIDIMKSDLTLFPKQDTTEAMWDVVDPIIGKKRALFKYRAFSAGPKEAEYIVKRDRISWREI